MEERWGEQAYFEEHIRWLAPSAFTVPELVKKATIFLRTAPRIPTVAVPSGKTLTPSGTFVASLIAKVDQSAIGAWLNELVAFPTVTLSGYNRPAAVGRRYPGPGASLNISKLRGTMANSS